MRLVHESYSNAVSYSAHAQDARYGACAYEAAPIQAGWEDLQRG